MEQYYVNNIYKKLDDKELKAFYFDLVQGAKKSFDDYEIFLSDLDILNLKQDACNMAQDRYLAGNAVNDEINITIVTVGTEIIILFTIPLKTLGPDKILI